MVAWRPSALEWTLAVPQNISFHKRFHFRILHTVGWKHCNFALRPMTMETRCSKVFFPNYLVLKNKPAEDTVVPPLWGTREKKMFVFLGLFAHAAVRGGTT